MIHNHEVPGSIPGLATRFITLLGAPFFEGASFLFIRRGVSVPTSLRNGEVEYTILKHIGHRIPYEDGEVFLKGR